MKARTRSFVLHITFALSFLVSALDAAAGEIQSLAWESTGDAPVLKITATGDTPFELSTHDDGLRSRISFPGSTVGPNLDELGAAGFVKGVFPYLSDNGSAVSVDLLLATAGQLDVQKAPDGLRVKAVSTATAAATAATPAAAAPEVVAPAAVVPAAAAPVAAPAAPAAAVVAAAPRAGKNALEEIRYARLSGDRVQLVLRMSGAPVEPAVFKSEKPDQPSRVVFDFANTRSDLPQKSIAVKGVARGWC
jgi:hypothetical protein